MNDNIIISTSPTPDLEIVKRRKNSILTIGWIGDLAGGHREALFNLFFPALKDLPFQVNLYLLGVGRKDKGDFEFLEDYFSGFQQVNLIAPRNIDWQNEVLIQNLISEFDIGIATLLDNELHRSKSAFKLKQYLNNGVPVFSSNLPENLYFLIDGKNGFLCDSIAQFRNRIIEINSMSAEEYKILSDNARQSIQEFTVASYCKTLAKLYH